MLKKQNRVNKHLFADVIKEGISYRSQNISLKTVKTPDTKPRFSVYVPKKELKSAVKRNLLRRRAQSALRKILPKAGLNFKVVILLKKRALTLPFSKLEDEIVFLLKKAGVL